MNKLQEIRNFIYKSRAVEAPNGEILTLNSAIDPNEGEAILGILKAKPEFPEYPKNGNVKLKKFETQIFESNT